ncbi:MAG TPA: 30S ribosome-binding factor RbfA [Lachnospiraceae bacterium]|nr:30S ribosome-binding factor RbfA [Lachnospiraceae bacterium]MBQ5534994.1 30S ribosome-binding factor RbfA [Lachnospiraceae bacterium]MBQ9568221.1 30S ribosome-binding factor RbfA [Lachnospiraceae bacterium]MCR4786021.1 30S ribosome-binding factor RbfA [Lachnospiraceae bacterium]HBB59463.1 30S ribosome-binding factor RbfA [Lachnospiraceae bacterium]
MRKNSTKNNRINSEVQKALSSIIRTVKDPRVDPFTSVVEVQVAPDLKTCKVYVSVLGDGGEETIEGLKYAAGYIRHELAREVNLRNTPELSFHLDTSISYGVDMTKKIEEVIKADEMAQSGRIDENGEE